MLGLRSTRRLVRHAGRSALLLPILSAAASGQEAGVVVSWLEPHSAAECAGLRAGDRLTRWEQGSGEATEGGAIGSPFDLLQLELERGPRGPVRLSGERNGEPVSASLFPDDWGLRARPALPAEAARLHDEARQRLEAGDTEAGLERLRRMAASLTHAPSPDGRSWALFEIARAEAGRRRADGAKAAVEQAVAALEEPGRAGLAAHFWSLLGRAFQDVERFDEAASAYERALELQRAREPEGLAAAAIAAELGRIAFERGTEMDEARRQLDGARALQERLAPRSLALVRTLGALGVLSRNEAESHGYARRALGLVEELAPETPLHALTLLGLTSGVSDLAGKVPVARRALSLYERLAPEGPGVVASLKQLGVILARLGEAAEAETHIARALALQERLAPGTRLHASLLNYAANLRRDRGDLAEAERLYRGSVEIAERLQPGSIWLAISLLNLGQLLHQRRDLDDAAAHLRRALEIAEKEAPQSDVTGYCLTTAGAVARTRGEVKEAEAYFRRALAVFRAVNPAHSLILEIQGEVAELLAEAGRLEEAETLQRAALEDAEKRAPRNLAAAAAHQGLGGLALRRGDLDTAERHLSVALDIRQELSPGSRLEAESSHALGVVFRRRERREEALALFFRAVEALEAQGRRLGGDKEAQARFRSHYQEFYRDLESLLLELGRPSEAFHVLERSRARGLLALLSSRDLRLEGGVPGELQRERRSAHSEYDQLLRALGRPTLAAEERAELRRKLEESRRRQDEVRARIRAAAPRLAALRDPEPLDLEGTRRALAPGTLLLSYAVGPESGRVYAVGPGAGDFAVASLAVTEAELRSQVEAFRQAIETRRSPLLLRAVEARSEALTRLLLGPVSEPVSRAERLLLIPDGVLHLLPFSALRDPSRSGRYLVETKGVHVASSATLFEQLSAPRPPVAESGAVVGFADPAYPGAPGGVSPRPPALRRAVGSGLRLDALPWTRQELEALRALAPGTARLWSGAEATEERVKALEADTRVLHLACHGFLDEAFPLESGLALSIPEVLGEGKDNGLLQAWEIFEDVRVDAELVTLSACQTGLGKEVAGEGLLGLTWAFQYAGARSVLASLWEVSDASTADLMRRFYGHLRQGRSKIEALRLAQAELLRKPATSSPYFWSAFQLVGDWR